MRKTDDKYQYDLVVIGSGPAGQKAAIAAAKHGKKVAIVDKSSMLGGISLHEGTIPSKTMREAILYLSGFKQRFFYGTDFTEKEKINRADLAMRISKVINNEMVIVSAQLKRNNVKIYDGTAAFIDNHTIQIEKDDNKNKLTTEFFLIACGARPARDKKIPFDDKIIIDSDQILNYSSLPKTITIVGAGVIGLEYASMFAALEVDVTIVDKSDNILNFIDSEIVDRLSYHFLNLNVVFRLNETVDKIYKDKSGKVITLLKSSKKIKSDALLYAIGRQTNADTLNLKAINLETDKRGLIKVDTNYRTAISNIYAAGDVIGFPALAATSMEQGRLASYNMFANKTEPSSNLLPFGIYTIPEIAMVGKTEQQLTSDKIPYEAGVARYDELAKGQILGTQIGYLKLLFDPKDLKLLGIHIIGESATELIHIGQTVLSFEGTLEYFRDAVFNYPSFAEAYKVAALDGFNKLE